MKSLAVWVVFIPLLVLVSCSKKDPSGIGAPEKKPAETPGLVTNDGNDAHGGDGYVAEFRNTGRRICKWLTENQAPLTEKVSSARFCEAVKRVIIESTADGLSLKGIFTDAINYPAQNRIVFNRERWQSLRAEHRLWQVVIHEVVSILGERADDVYLVSDKIIAAAFPDIVIKGSYYRGRLPSCESEVLVGDLASEELLKGTIGVELVPGETNSDWVGAHYYFRNGLEGDRKVLAESMVCDYGTFPSEVFKCRGGGNHQFKMENIDGLMSIKVRSPYIAGLLVRNRAVSIEQSFARHSIISYEQWGDLVRGALPLHIEDLKSGDWANYTRHGAATLGDELVMSFSASDCRWNAQP